MSVTTISISYTLHNRIIVSRILTQFSSKENSNRQVIIKSLSWNCFTWTPYKVFIRDLVPRYINVHAYGWNRALFIRRLVLSLSGHFPFQTNPTCLYNPINMNFITMLEDVNDWNASINECSLRREICIQHTFCGRWWLLLFLAQMMIISRIRNHIIVHFVGNRKEDYSKININTFNITYLRRNASTLI